MSKNYTAYISFSFKQADVGILSSHTLKDFTIDYSFTLTILMNPSPPVVRILSDVINSIEDISLKIQIKLESILINSKKKKYTFYEP